MNLVDLFRNAQTSLVDQSNVWYNDIIYSYVNFTAVDYFRSYDG